MCWNKTKHPSPFQNRYAISGITLIIFWFWNSHFPVRRLGGIPQSFFVVEVGGWCPRCWAEKAKKVRLYKMDIDGRVFCAYCVDWNRNTFWNFPESLFSSTWALVLHFIKPGFPSTKLCLGVEIAWRKLVRSGLAYDLFLSSISLPWW